MGVHPPWQATRMAIIGQRGHDTHLSFTSVADGAAIQVYCDEEGLNGLIANLEEREAGHVHLRSPSNGGTVLNDQTPWGNEAIGEVVITTKPA